MPDVYLTRDGFNKIQKQLEDLKKERVKIARAIEEARLQGDISENAEYDAAKDAQAHNAAAIAEVENKLASVRIIEDQNIPGDAIYIGAVVSLKDLDTGEEPTYMLVSQEEADYEANKISITSPIGAGLLGKAANEEIELEVPAGKLRYKILKIKRPK